MKPTKCQAKEKKWGKKSERRAEERKRKEKVKTAVSLSLCLKILLSTHAWPSEANILYLDQKAAKCTNCK